MLLGKNMLCIWSRPHCVCNICKWMLSDLHILVCCSLLLFDTIAWEVLILSVPSVVLPGITTFNNSLC